MFANIIFAFCIGSNSCLMWFSKFEMTAQDSPDDMLNVLGLQIQCKSINLNQPGMPINKVKSADDGDGYG